jgi:hypothetical protein
VVAFVRYTGVGRAAGYFRKTGMRLVLDSNGFILTNPITTFGVKFSRFIVLVGRWL